MEDLSKIDFTGRNVVEYRTGKERAKRTTGRIEEFSLESDGLVLIWSPHNGPRITSYFPWEIWECKDWDGFVVITIRDRQPGGVDLPLGTPVSYTIG